MTFARRLFIIDAVITLPIAILGMVFLPALPGQKGWKPSFWLKQQDLEVIERRLESIKRAPPAPFTWSRIKGYAKGWHVWVLPVLYGAFSLLPSRRLLGADFRPSPSQSSGITRSMPPQSWRYGSNRSTPSTPAPAYATPCLKSTTTS